MSNYFKVDTKQLDRAARDFSFDKLKLMGLQAEIIACRVFLLNSTSMDKKVFSSLNKVSSDLGKIYGDIDEMGDALTRIGARYSKADKTVALEGMGVVPITPVLPPISQIIGTQPILTLPKWQNIVYSVPEWNGWKSIVNGDLEWKTESSDLGGFLGTDGKSFYRFMATATSATMAGSMISGIENDDAIYKRKQEKKDYKNDSENDSWYKSKAIASYKMESKKEGSIGELHLEGKGEYTQGSTTVKAVTGETHSSFEAGFYVESKDENGKTIRKFSPGVKTEVGGSFSAIEAEASGKWGLGEDNNMLGVHGDVKAQAGHGEAKGKISVSANEVYGEASAEVDVVKVEGSAGVSVLGVDADVTGAVKVGFGAHAKVGYTDGKLKCDLGIAAGLGVDVGFEVDVKGAVKAAKGYAKGVYDWAASLNPFKKK